MTNNIKKHPKFLELMNEIYSQEKNISANDNSHIDSKFINLINTICDGDSRKAIEIIDMVEKDIAERTQSIPKQLIKDFLLEVNKIKEDLHDNEENIILEAQIKDKTASNPLQECVERLRKKAMSDNNIKNINKKI